MIEQQAVVHDCQGERALVEVQRASACGGCAEQAGCGTGAIARYFGQRTARVSVGNPTGARPGDTVVVGYDERAFLRAAVLLYLLPITMFAAGAAGLAVLGGTEGWGVAGAVAGLAAGLGLSRHLAGGSGAGELTILRRTDAAAVLLTPPGVVRDRCHGEP
jgi:sigma-E factor negative regulatory protein RseC